jgi:hypothetical protein
MRIGEKNQGEQEFTGLPLRIINTVKTNRILNGCFCKQESCFTAPNHIYFTRIRLQPIQEKMVTRSE